MNIKDYASDVNLSVAEVLKKCHELGIKGESATDILSDDDIVILDNTINIISANEETNFEEEEVIEEKVDDIILANNNYKNNLNLNTKQKLKKKDEFNSKNDFKELKKEMYKNKSKLKNNESDEEIIVFKEGMTLYELAEKLVVNPAELIKKLISLGLMITINDKIDYEVAEMLASEYQKSLKKEETQDVSNFESYEISDKAENLIKRPPVVTIMGHVDHGKTTLLDYLRKTKMAQAEAGGITQTIGAYQIDYNGEKITFIDTPGHAAFTEMRARGASITDIVIIIVAADDGVMPQTKEAIDHALNANVPIIVAINKIDKPNANIEKVMTELSEINITPEEWGGEYPFIKLSAITGEGIDLLLETILTIAEVNNYEANPNRYAVGTVIESKQDKNVGGIAAFLIQNGTLRIGDPIVVGTSYAKIRTMKDDQGSSIVEAGPSTPVEVTGLSDNPIAGDKFMAFETESEAKKIAEERKDHLRKNENEVKPVTLDDLFASIENGKKEVNVVLKTDVRGSEEAVKSALEKISVEDIVINVIRSGIGTITESDVVLAAAGNALIIGFNVSPSTMTKELANDYHVEIRLYNIIYKVVEDMELALQGMLDPTFKEKILGTSEIRKIFKFSKVGNIAGVYIIDGIMKNNTEVRIIRDDLVIATTKIASIQREKDTVKEVKKGFECGLTFENYNDFKIGDKVECYEMEEVKNGKS